MRRLCQTARILGLCFRVYKIVEKCATVVLHYGVQRALSQPHRFASIKDEPLKRFGFLKSWSLSKTKIENWGKICRRFVRQASLNSLLVS